MPKAAHELSLVDLAGQPVKDIYGLVSREFGEPCFEITRIDLADGRAVSVGGEHDIAYIEDYENIVPLPERKKD